ncbi:hypothetical protein ACFVKB_48820 [Rhodococcus sp. NPDC127530]|uniref:hypothetical protein n=1 Tax=unclassified Rhodococcus (in: high G+C Gram-positive bacteria) TaxID=192944 RepID=UPI003645BC68
MRSLRIDDEPETLLETVEIDPDRADPELAPDYNVAPTKTSPVVVARPPKDTGDDQPQRQLRNLTGGLFPDYRNVA